MDITLSNVRVAELAEKYGVRQSVTSKLFSGEDERKTALDEIEMFFLNIVRWYLVEAEDIKDALEIINQFGAYSLCGIFADEYLLEYRRINPEIDGDSLDLEV